MRDRLLSGGLALVRLVLVVVAFGLAVGSIAVSSTRGFCPEVETQALAMPALATIVEEPSDQDGTQDGATEDGATDGGATDPSDGECPGGAQRCLPSLWSSILILGEPACHEQAGSVLRGTLVPAFVGSTVLLAAAWWLRPTRLQARRDRVTAD